MNNLIHENVKDQIESYYLDLLIECIEQRPKIDIHNNYLLQSAYTNQVYDSFISLCRKKLNPFTITSLDFKIYCCLSDKDTHETNLHNHSKEGQITGILYLKIPDSEKHKIEFVYTSNRKSFFYPKNFDFLILPSTLNHMPYPSKDKEKRISLNLNLKCKESIEYIFGFNRDGNNR